MKTREIKFRGKRVDNGEWVYGGIFYTSHLNIGYQIMIDIGTKYQVISETVGQYTGLKDKNGKEIYEGDILEFNYTLDETQNIKGLVYFDEEEAAYYFKHELKTVLSPHNNDNWKRNQNHFVKENQYAVIIGNIHDNPELLK